MNWPPKTDDLQFYGLGVQTLAIVSSFVGVILIINYNLRIARRRATLDIVLNEETHKETIDERTKFIKLKSNGNLLALATAAIDSPELQTVRSVLNRYELVAIGLRRATLDENIYKDWCRTTLVDDWIAVKSLIVEIREKNKARKIFREFELLARRWAIGDERSQV